MPNFVQVTMDFCDAVGLQSAWMFLAMGIYKLSQPQLAPVS